MNATRNNTLLKSSTGFRNFVLAGTLAFSSTLVLVVTSPVSAEESISHSDNESDINRQQQKRFINSIDLQYPDKTWRNNTSVIAQIGNDNRASVAQSRNTAEFTFGNYANITQYGNNNEANIIQSGGNNIGLIGQIGNDHNATIEQNGNSFEARVNQLGIKSDINISQSGSGQGRISVSQRANSGAAAPVTIRTY